MVRRPVGVGLGLLGRYVGGPRRSYHHYYHCHRREGGTRGADRVARIAGSARAKRPHVSC